MFKCRTCNHYQEELFFELLNTHQREILMNEEKNTCDNCSDVNWTAKISLFQLDSTSKTHRYGVDGYYSKALGKHVDSPAAEQKIMEKRGFVCEADLAPHFWDDKTQKIKDRISEQDQYIARYNNAIENGKSKEEAAVELAPTEDIQSGKTDTLWSDKI
jgi:hypothetical protein|tara:strand:+ start:620 stop:1096 length:477 start_codon:yes stop_codon:yes gene_type:complete